MHPLKSSKLKSDRAQAAKPGCADSASAPVASSGPVSGQGTSSGPSSGASSGLRVVALGGGTGLSTLLRGLRGGMFSAPGQSFDTRCAIADLAAVVTVTDDGGSSGRLRQDFNMLPPGDLRNCMVALSEEEDLLSQLFTHRFRGGNGLKGHNFGNLFVAALTGVPGILRRRCN